MGKGDRRSLRGKLFRGTFGKTRPHRVKSAAVVATTVTTKPIKEAAVEKAKGTEKKRTTKKKEKEK